MTLTASSIGTVAATTSLHPLEWPGSFLIFDSEFTKTFIIGSAPGSLSALITDIFGQYYAQTQTLPAPAAGVADSLAEDGKVIQLVYPIGLRVGDSIGAFTGWTNEIAGNDVFATPIVSKFYVEYRQRILESTFQNNTVGTKMFGYVGYGGQGFDGANQM